MFITSNLSWGCAHNPDNRIAAKNLIPDIYNYKKMWSFAIVNLEERPSQQTKRNRKIKLQLLKLIKDNLWIGNISRKNAVE